MLKALAVPVPTNIPAGPTTPVANADTGAARMVVENSCSNRDTLSRVEFSASQSNFPETPLSESHSQPF